MNDNEVNHGSVDDESRWRLSIRVLCIVVEVILVLWLGKEGVTFFYQGF